MRPSSDVPETYTLKTKISWTAAEDELSKVTLSGTCMLHSVLCWGYVPTRMNTWHLREPISAYISMSNHYISSMSKLSCPHLPLS